MRTNAVACGLMLVFLLMLGCASVEVEPDLDDALGTSDPMDVGAELDGGLIALDVRARDAAARDAGPLTPPRRCPTTGPDAMEGDVCWVVTPLESGLSGDSADVDQYALRPVSPVRGELLLFMNGSNNEPASAAGSATGSFYGVARGEGLNVLGVSYRDMDAIGGLCRGNDACFEPTRRTLLTGRYLTGAHASLSDIRVYEGVYARALAALVYLADHDRAGGWEAFFDRARLSTPESALRWDRILVSGSAQGGGHAAMVGRDHAVARVVMLAAPCDVTGTDRATAVTATWLINDDEHFATDTASRYYGLGTPADDTCPWFASNWDALGMVAANQNASAVTCDETPRGHSMPLLCDGNASNWAAMLR